MIDTGPSFVQAMIFAIAPITGFLVLMAFLAFVPVAVRRRMTPWIGGLLAVAAAIVFTFLVIERQWVAAAFFLFVGGLASINTAWRLKPVTFAYGGVASGLVVGLTGAVVGGLNHIAFGRPASLALAALAAAYLAFMAYSSIRKIRAGGVAGPAGPHSTVTGTTA